MNSKEKKFLKKLFLNNKLFVLYGIVFSIVFPLLILKSADFMKNLVDLAVVGDFISIPRELIYTATFILGTRLLFFIVNVFSDNIILRFKSKLQYQVVNLIVAEDIDQVIKKDVGDLITRTTRDIDIIVNDIFINATQKIPFTLISALSSMIYLINLHPKLAFIVIFLGPLPMFVSLLFQKRVRKVGAEVAEKNSLFTSYLKELFSGINFIRTAGAFMFFDDKTLHHIRDLRDSRGKEILINQGSNLANQVIQSGIMIAIFGLGSLWAARGELSVGTLIAFVQLLNNLVSPFGAIGGYIISYNRGLVSVDRISEVTIGKVPTEYNHNQLKTKNQGFGHRIDFKNVSFSYSSTSVILKDCSFTIYPGEKVAIVGENGMGKSTILKILVGLCRGYKGQILIDHCNVRDMQMIELQNHFNFVDQDTFVFSGSILDNLRMVDVDITENKIHEVLQITGLDKVASELPNGIFEKIGDAGSNLSGGQKKRLAIARALIRENNVLLLDEPSLHLDSDYLQLIEVLLEKYYEQTIIYVTHENSLLKYADRILRICNGSLKEISKDEIGLTAT